MNNDVTAAVDAWVDRALTSLTTVEFVQIDLDKLLHDPPAAAVRTGLNCLELAVAGARGTDSDVDGILVIPLAYSDTLTQSSPGFNDVLTDPWEYGPGLQVPGLYLVRPSLWRGYEGVEEYRRHLSTDGQLPPGYAAYYRTWRSCIDDADGREYTRAIYVRTVDRAWVTSHRLR